MEQFVYHDPKRNKEVGRGEMHSIDFEIDGELIGSAEIDYFSKPFPLYQISDLYVIFGKHGKGYGSRIMEQVEKMLLQKRKAGVIVDAIDSDSPARGMYERRGWIKVPGSSSLFAFNLPRGARPEDLRGYPMRQTQLSSRASWHKLEH